MARHRVTYLEAPPPAPAGRRREVALGPPPPPPAAPVPSPRGRRRPWLPVAGAAVLAAMALAWWSDDSPTPPPPARTAEGAVDPAADHGPVVIRASAVAPAPWSGVFEHHPDDRGVDPVVRVHAFALASPDRAASAVVIVDATRRAFGQPERAWRSVDERRRSLGDETGTGLRTWQWDVAGYGVSLTTSGLPPEHARRVAIALDVPGGPSLTTGAIPTFDAEVLGRAGVDVVAARSVPATPVGSPLIGQAGGASIDGVLHDGAGRIVLVSVVQGAAADAAFVRRALGPAADAPVAAIDGALEVAAVAHPGEPERDRRVRGWSHVWVDLPGDVTAELASDTLAGPELLALAASLDLQRLGRTVAPPG